MDSSCKPNWWDRNWRWFVPAVCVLLMLVVCSFIGLVFYGVSSAMKSTDAYQLAVQRARSDPEVTAAIGDPIIEGFFTTGSINTSGSSGSADMAIPISGPKGEAVIYLSATKSVGRWKFDDLIVDIDTSGDRIDLLQDHQTH